ncbi:MAG: hypothetical protein ACK5YZ_02145 [bacterium]
MEEEVIKSIWLAPFLFLLGCSLTRAGSLEKDALAFLNQWLVYGELDKALRYVSDRGPLCVPDSDTSELSSVTPREARERLRAAMATVLKTVGKHSNLGAVINPVPPNFGNFVGKPGNGGLPFTVWDVPAKDLLAMTCNSPTNRVRGTVVFVFRGPMESQPAGGMYIVFERYGSNWRIVGFNALRQ